MAAPGQDFTACAVMSEAHRQRLNEAAATLLGVRPRRYRDRHRHQWPSPLGSARLLLPRGEQLRSGPALGQPHRPRPAARRPRPTVRRSPIGRAWPSRVGYLSGTLDRGPGQRKRTGAAALRDEQPPEPARPARPARPADSRSRDPSAARPGAANGLWDDVDSWLRSCGEGEAVAGVDVGDRTLWRVPGGGVLYRTPAMADGAVSLRTFSVWWRSTRTPDSDVGHCATTPGSKRRRWRHRGCVFRRQCRLSDGGGRRDRRGAVEVEITPVEDVEADGGGPRRVRRFTRQRDVGGGRAHRPAGVERQGGGVSDIQRSTADSGPWCPVRGRGWACAGPGHGHRKQAMGRLSPRGRSTDADGGRRKRVCGQ